MFRLNRRRDHRSPLNTTPPEAQAPSKSQTSLIRRVRMWLYAAALNGGVGGIMGSVKLLPYGRKLLSRIEVQKNIPYLDDGDQEHTLDVYRPRGVEGPLPVMLYLHGGGFCYLSKDTHWLLGALFADQGYVVVNANYRLSPRVQFPAALEDAAEALAWIGDNAASIGADTDRLMFAGESAGANLITSLTVAACWERPEPVAKRIWETGLVPQVISPACGMLQVTDTQRLATPDLPQFIVDRLAQVSSNYLPRGEAPPEGWPLADPVVILEGADAADRPLPACFVMCGGRDPLVPDSNRLGAAWERLGAPVDLKIYEGGHHAFHALLHKPLAKEAWADQFAYIGAHLPPGEPR
ncbi:MAG: alpha/beta hydrolase [Myxococcota bacterium]|nr:alpha/beta hydrolase [Myxococcota bacterium]